MADPSTLGQDWRGNGGDPLAAGAVAPTVEERAEAARRVAARLGLEYVDLRTFRINADLFRRIPFDVMLRYGFLLLYSFYLSVFGIE